MSDPAISLDDYEPIQSLKQGNAVMLVSERSTKYIYVMKIREVYDPAVYQYLRAHPQAGLPRIVNCLERNDKLVVIEEFISGRKLDDILKERGHLELAEAIGIMRRLCQILEPLHRLNPPIVHRDIKPSNIIVSSDGSITLIDFNSAKQSYEAQSRDTVLIGTQGYAAPEQYGFSVSKPSTDVYALGVLFNELLTGHPLAVHAHDGLMSDVIQGCCRMEPSARYQDAGELLAAIDALLIKEDPKLVLPSGWRGWLPPGFRQFKPLRWILSGLGYALLLDIGLTMDVDGGGLIDTILSSILFLCIAAGMIVYWGDYRYLRSRLPGIEHPNRFLFWTIRIAYAYLIILIPMVIYAILLSLLT